MFEVDKYREALGTQVADFFQEVLEMDPERHRHQATLLNYGNQYQTLVYNVAVMSQERLDNETLIRSLIDVSSLSPFLHTKRNKFTVQDK